MPTVSLLIGGISSSWELDCSVDLRLSASFGGDFSICRAIEDCWLGNSVLAVATVSALLRDCSAWASRTALRMSSATLNAD